VIGQRVRKLREARGWTQQQLADRAGLTNDTISNYERGGRRGQKAPSLPTVKAIADALGVSMDDLLAEPEPEVAATP
jgi:transcriptional regulator with XRE-family HTH domain